MKALMKKYLFLLIILIAIPLLNISCNSPASPPAPPLETPLPIALKFVPYEDIRIDLSTISAPVVSGNIVKAIGAGGEFSGILGVEEFFLTEFENVLTGALSLLNLLEIPISEDTTTFETTIEEGPGTLNELKLDFADFDLDGLNGAEGCSGHTAELPVCVRMWLDGERLVAWVFDTYPLPASGGNPANPGKSRFRLLFPVFTIIYQFAIDLDHRDPLNVSNEFFSKTVTIDANSWHISQKHMDIYQQGEQVTALKGLNLDWRFDEFDLTDTLISESSLQYLGQFREGSDFWSGSILGFHSIDGTFGETDLCAQISTGNRADSSECDAVGITATGIPFVTPLVDADVEFYDFPETPTF